MARHRRAVRNDRPRLDAYELIPARRTVRLVHAGDGVEHRLTRDNHDAGQSGEAPYAALCGVAVLPAAMATPEQRVCSECVRRTIPAPR
jgi:hypothetical protein